jgi:3-hydroxyisobutyrate dehydrogenase
MAACVARAGHQVLAYDIDPSRAQSLATDGVNAATTVSQAAHGAEVLAVMVATPAQVEAVLYGDDPAAAALPPGSVVLVMATVGPAAVQDWATRLATQELHLVDAPVSGGVARAAAGDLLIMVAAPEATLPKVRPVLDAMARTAPVVGAAPGDGQKVKLVNQLLCGVHIAVAAEALAFAEAMGLDAETTWAVIRHGAAASFMLDDRGQRMVHGSFERANSALDIFVKDMGLVIDAARHHGYPAPLAVPQNSSTLPDGEPDSAGWTTPRSSRSCAAESMRPEVVADQSGRAEAQRTHMQVIAANPALGARGLQDLLAAERVVAAAIAADLGVDQTDLQPQVAAAAAVNALRGAFMAWFLSGGGGDPQPAFDQALDLLEHGLGTLSASASRHPRSAAAHAPSGDAEPDDEVAQPGTR